MDKAIEILNKYLRNDEDYSQAEVLKAMKEYAINMFEKYARYRNTESQHNDKEPLEFKEWINLQR